MTGRRTNEPTLAVRITWIALAVIGAGAFLTWLDGELDAPGTMPEAEGPASVVPATRPIAAEARVFLSPPAEWIEGTATGSLLRRRRAAHPRTLATSRAVRAYPGAPPRVPHGLTDGEFRNGECNTCHERGGYVPRFSAYAPRTPHPELEACLQCHAVSDGVVGARLPGVNPDDLCAQCHVAATIGRAPPAFRGAGLDWRSAPWPVLRPPVPDGPPLAIPHTLNLRGNCNACHAGMGAIEELRTTHPERVNCRQCHVHEADPDAVFTRPAAPGTTGGVP